MSKRLSSLSSKPELTQYAQRLAGQRIRARAKFLAPTVEVANPVGRFKKYDEKHRFFVPDTRRNPGGSAVKIGFTAEDATYNCQYHAVDVPADRAENDAVDDVMNLAMEHMDLAADVQALSHERSVIRAALSALGAGADHNFTSDSVDPIAIIDLAIRDLLRATAGSLPIKIAWGPTAFLRFKANKHVRDRFKVGKGAGSSSGESITLESIRPLFMTEPNQEIFLMVEDAAPEGKDRDLEFLLDDSIIIFASSDKPTRFDPSFLKTFRKMGAWLRPRIYETPDGRADVVASDWSEDVQLGNAQGGVRINANAT